MAEQTEPDCPPRYSKTPAPYNREYIEGFGAVVDPHGEFLGVKDGFEWVFDRAEECTCVEKLDGTNCAVRVVEHEHGGYYVDQVAARDGPEHMNVVQPFDAPYGMHDYITRAVQNTASRGYLDRVVDEYGTGWFYGEALGPQIHDNLYDLDEHLFIPFDWARQKLEYNSYGRHDTDYESIKNWMRGADNGIFSLFHQAMHGGDLSELTPDAGTYVEGVIIIHPDFDRRLHPNDFETSSYNQHFDQSHQVVKIKREMFSAYRDGEWPLTDLANW